MKTVVVDTNVLVAALRSRNGASYKLLSMIGTGDFNTVVSVPLVLEYEYAVAKAVAEMGDSTGTLSMLSWTRLAGSANIRTSFSFGGRFVPDSNDDMILEVAVASSADGIVTFNKRDFGYAIRFGLSIWTPREFLNEEDLL